MPLTLELEREFFKISQNFEYWEDVRRHFMKRVKVLAEDFIDYKMRCEVAGLKRKEKKQHKP